MLRQLAIAAALGGCLCNANAQSDSVNLNTVVVTGARYSSDLRHLPFDVSVVKRDRLTADYQPSILPSLSQQVPGLFVTTRGVLG